jgi:hypothetical protein
VVEVLPAKLASPVYTAVIEWLPVASALVVNVAAAEAFNAPVPSVVAPSLNVTLPVGVPAIVEVIVAVNVTDCPNVDGLTDEMTAVTVAGKFTDCVTVFEVLAAKFASPGYVAVIGWFPVARVLVMNVATPTPFSAPVPNVLAPSLNVTVPVGVPADVEVIVAVKVTD